MPLLTHKKPNGEERVLQLGDKPLILGRLPESDIPVRDSFISRVHCGLRYENNQYTLKDLGSTNGTYRNGARVFECTLQSGDRIQVGNTTLVFEIDQATGNALLRQVPNMVAATRAPGAAPQPVYNKEVTVAVPRPPGPASDKR